MQARVYRPDSGRFLSQDRYEAAAGDQALQTDSLTQNRYAFAGGNPVTNVEFDGHMPTREPGSCNAACRRQRHHDNANANRSGRNRDAGGRPPTPQSRARAQERYYSTFQMRPPPPVDHLHAKHSPEEAERVLEEWEKEHGQHMSAGTRLMHLQALQDGHWYKILEVEQPNPYAGPVALAVLTTVPIGRVGTGACRLACRGLLGRGAAKGERVLPPVAGGAPLLGEGGVQVTSRTLLRDAGRGFRIDVENPAPGFRPGQLHLQDTAGGKYLYDFEANEFTGLPRSLHRRVANDPEVARAISKGRDYLNVEHP
jgi:RHS repeat-associated protein